MRTICIVIDTRTEYGLFYWLMKDIQEDADLELQIIVAGMHLSPEFGLTYRQIEKDCFKIDRKIERLLSSDTPAGIQLRESGACYNGIFGIKNSDIGAKNGYFGSINPNISI